MNEEQLERQVIRSGDLWREGNSMKAAKEEVNQDRKIDRCWENTCKHLEKRTRNQRIERKMMNVSL